MTNLYKTFDDNFKKEVNALIKQGLKKELPAGAVYSASKKPPEGAREFTTDRGTKYWIPSKKDKEDKQAKPKSLSERFWRGEPDAYKELDALPPKKFAQTINRLQTGSGRQNLMLVHRYGSSEEKKKMKALYEGPWLASDRKARLKQLDWAGKINKKYRAILDKDVEKEKAKPKASSTPKTGREQFTDKQRAELSNEVDISRKNLSVEAEELHLFTVNDADIYRQRETPIIDNLKKKMKKGVYERAKAEKLAKYMFDDASKKYDNSTSGHTFSPDERREAAAHWVKDFEDNYAFGEYD